MNAEDVLNYKGHSVAGLTLGQTFLISCGQLPDPAKALVIEHLATLFTDCGTIAPSTAAVRMSASCGATTWQAIIAGIACFGEHHFPVEAAARCLIDGWMPGTGLRTPGYGHPYFKGRDPRVDEALKLAAPYVGKHVALAIEWEKQLGVGLNPAGGAAAILADMGIPANAMPFVLLAGRMMGWCLHIEEQREMRPIMRAEQMKELI